MNTAKPDSFCSFSARLVASAPWKADWHSSFPGPRGGQGHVKSYFLDLYRLFTDTWEVLKFIVHQSVAILSGSVFQGPGCRSDYWGGLSWCMIQMKHVDAQERAPDEIVASVSQILHDCLPVLGSHEDICQCLDTKVPLRCIHWACVICQYILASGFLYVWCFLHQIWLCLYCGWRWRSVQQDSVVPLGKLSFCLANWSKYSHIGLWFKRFTES